MRFVIAFVGVAFSLIARAQELPQCAAEAVGDNFGDCSAVDIGCICSNDGLLSDLACRVTETCSPEEIETLLTFARNLCEPQGVTLPDNVECPGGEAAGDGDGDNDDDEDEDEDEDDVTDTESVTLTDDDESPVTASAAAAHLGVAGVGFSAAFAGLLGLL